MVYNVNRLDQKEIDIMKKTRVFQLRVGIEHYDWIQEEMKRTSDTASGIVRRLIQNQINFMQVIQEQIERKEKNDRQC